MINEKDIKKRLLKFSNRLSDLIEDVITNKGKTRELQATEMEITKSNLSKYCASNNADKDVPRLRADTLMRIADYYGVSIDYLLARTDRSTLPEEDKNLIRDIHGYTGLNETAINNLQKAKDHYFKKLIINKILSNEDFIDKLTMYYISSFVDIYKQSYYYIFLPQRNYEFSDVLFGDSQKAERMATYDLQSCLTTSRNDFYKKHCIEIETKKRKSKTLHEIARIFVNFDKAKKEIKDPKVSQTDESIIIKGLREMGNNELAITEDPTKYRKELLKEIDYIK